MNYTLHLLLHVYEEHYTDRLRQYVVNAWWPSTG